MAVRYSGQIVTDGLVLALDASSPRSYPGSGTTWYDLSGNGHDATMDVGIEHKSGSVYSMQLNGTSHDMTVVSQSAIFPTTITACGWVSLDTIQRDAGVTYNNFYRNGSSGTEIQERGDGYWRWWVNTTGDGWQYVIYSGSLIETGRYYFIAGTYDKDTGIQKLYVDGVLRDTKNRGIYPVNYFAADFRIGSNAGTTRFIDGNIGNLYIYNRALSAAEILQNYNATKGRFL